MTFQHLVADFVTELESLNQAIANLRVCDVLLIAGQPLGQPIHRICQRGKVELLVHLFMSNG
jgi:hypothetical protein